MTKAKKNGVLFDLDGTLWDSSRQILPAWNAVLDAYPGLRAPVTLEEIGSYMGLTPEVMSARMFPMLEPRAALEMLYRCFDAETEVLKQSGAILYDGVPALLSALHERYFVAVVSNSQDGYVQAFLDYYDLWNYVDDIEMAGRTGLPKGDNIGLVLDRAGIERADALYVGDTQGDLEAADQAGIGFVYAAYGFGKIARKAVAAENPEQLLPLIETAFGK